MKYIILILILSTPLIASSKQVMTSNFKVQNARVFIPPKGTKVLAGYAKFINESDKPLSIKVEKAAGFKAIELHQTFNKAGKMAMRKVDTLKIPKSGSIILKPGGYHLMLFDPTIPIKNGDKISVTFKSNNKEQIVKFKLVPRESMSGKKHNSHHHH